MSDFKKKVTRLFVGRNQQQRRESSMEWVSGDNSWGQDALSTWDTNDISNQWNFKLPENEQVKIHCGEKTGRIHLEVGSTCDSPLSVCCQYFFNIHNFLQDAMFSSGNRVLFSCPETWELFMSQQPTVVAIECEDTRPGDQEFPMMVQIAANNLVIIEYPADFGESPKFSTQLVTLLCSQSILKVFFTGNGNISSMLTKIVSPKIDILELVLQADYLSPYQRENLDSVDMVMLLKSVKKIKYEKCSIVKNGWRSLKTTWTMRQNRNFINFAAAEVWGVLQVYEVVQGDHPSLVAALRRDPPPAEAFPEGSMLSSLHSITLCKSADDKGNGEQGEHSCGGFREEGKQEEEDGDKDIRGDVCGDNSACCDVSPPRGGALVEESKSPCTGAGGENG